VALCLDVQLVVSTTDPILRSLVRRVTLADSEPNRQLLLPSDNNSSRNIAITLIDRVLSVIA